VKDGRVPGPRKLDAEVQQFRLEAFKAAEEINGWMRMLFGPDAPGATPQDVLRTMAGADLTPGEEAVLRWVCGETEGIELGDDS
jgi:hypothetical protein